MCVADTEGIGCYFGFGRHHFRPTPRMVTLALTLGRAWIRMCMLGAGCFHLLAFFVRFPQAAISFGALRLGDNHPSVSHVFRACALWEEQLGTVSARGFVDWYPDVECAVRDVGGRGPLILSPLGYIRKERDGVVKNRIITDLREANKLSAMFFPDQWITPWRFLGP
eukprot:6491912-Amphidinium_carterae.3